MYRYLIIDGQYLLTRNFKLLTSRYDNVTPGGILTTTYQSVARLRRDFVDFEIPLFIFDKGPYYKSTLVDGYKGSRYYCTEADLEGVTDEKEIERINQEIALNKLKEDTKKLILDIFPKLGIPCIMYQGWEADDLAYLITKLSNTNSCLCSSDSDWTYLSNEHVDLMTFKSDFYIYSEQVANINKDLLCKIGGYQMYKAYIDSLYGSHNDLTQSVRDDHKRDKLDDLINKLSDSVTDELVNSKLFSAQLSTFRFNEFPSYNEVVTYINNTLNSLKYDKLNFEQFIEVVKNNNIRVTYNYYSDFIDNLKY